MKKRIAGGLLLGLLLGAAPVPAQILYRVTDLGTLPGGTGALGKAVNNAGQVTGLARIGFNEFAFLYSNGQLTHIEARSSGYGINNAGQVVGETAISTTYPSDWHAFLYSDAQMTDLGTLGGPISRASGINNTGQVVGGADTSSGAYHAF